MDAKKNTLHENGMEVTKVLDKLWKYNEKQRSDDRVGETIKVQKSSGRGKAHPIIGNEGQDME
jgi:hypothetical protein